eukprot:TRINITY_DN974_c0_g1_i2.p1 TRINITY_DN974_c0_g1~~TRINITY_DN974_c0_g1_i2.p1  ORF type:complete len:100 (+),score=25.92 TRINITY_DN974_c0_g1_i2:123-422(+)
MRRILSPFQVAKALMLLEKERNSRELSAEKLWASSLSKQNDEDEQEFIDTPISTNPPKSNGTDLNGFNTFLEFKEYDLVDLIKDPYSDFLRRFNNTKPS